MSNPWTDALLENMLKMLRRLLGELVIIDFAGLEVALDRWGSGMIEQVVMNLCVNARDAMPKGGPLSVRRSALVKADLFGSPGSACRPVRPLSVKDGGCGMDGSTLARIFEPFFTTKGWAKARVWVWRPSLESSSSTGDGLKSRASLVAD